MADQPAALHRDTGNKVTSAEWADDGDGVDRWILWIRNAVLGEINDAAVTDPATNATGIALLKGLLTFLRVSAAGLGKGEDLAHTTGDTGVMALAVRRDTAAASSGATGEYEPLQTDSTGRLRTAVSNPLVGALLNARTTALDDILLVKASAGTLFGFQGYVDTDGYVVVVEDADGTISGGAQCVEAVHIVDPTGGGAGGPFSLDFGQYGLAVATGICLAFSSTGPTFTNGGAHMFASAQYQ